MFSKLFLMFSFFSFYLHANTSFNIALYGEPSSFVHNVNVITGDYCDREDDLVVQGTELIELTRLYCSGSNRTLLAGTFFPNHCYAYIHHFDRNTILIPEKEGCLLPYGIHHASAKNNGNYTLSLQDDVSKQGITNTYKGAISGRFNAKNNTGTVSKDRKMVVFRSADGSVRYYKYDEKETEKKRDRGFPMFAATIYNQESWAELHDQCDYYYLEKERLPSGHWVYYEFGYNGDIKRIKVMPYEIDGEYDEKTHGKALLSWVNFSVNRKRGTRLYYTSLDVKTSDQKTAKYHFTTNETKYYFGASCLNKVEVSDRPEQILAYDGEFNKYNHDDWFFLLKERAFPNGQSERIEYVTEGDKKQVKTILAQTGGDATHLPMYKFEYFPKENYTEVRNAYNLKTIYRYNDEFRLVKIEHYDELETKTHTEQFVWGDKDTPQQTFLVCKLVLDSKDQAQFARSFTYDESGNVILETVYGDLTGSCKIPIVLNEKNLPTDNGVDFFWIKREFSQDGRNLLTLEEDQNGYCVEYVYKKDCILLESKFTSYRSSDTPIYKTRMFFTYDQNLFLVEEIEDGLIDNLTDRERVLDPKDLSVCIQRTIKKVTPRKEQPFLGLAKSITQKDINVDTGKERTLFRKELNYSPMGQVASENIYDAQGKLLQEHEFSYDDKNRLVESTDPMGRRTCYRYDDNFNLISEYQIGHPLTKEYQYDYSNRLRVADEWECKSIEKSERGKFKCGREDIGDHRKAVHGHDLLSRPTFTRDFRGNTTHYQYGNSAHLQKVRLPEVYVKENTKTSPEYSYEYDDLERKIKETDPEKGQTQIVYNSRSEPVQHIFADQSAETFTYYLDGKLHIHTDPSGLQTTYFYDDYLRRETRIEKRSSDGTLLSIETFDYNSLYLICSTDPEDNSTAYEYDSMGRQVAVIKGNQRIDYSYDPLGNLVSETQKNRNKSFTRDSLGQVLKEEVFDTEQSNTDPLYWISYEYDSVGNCISTTQQIDGQLAKHLWEYDVYGREIKHIDPLEHKTCTSYIDQAYDETMRGWFSVTRVIDPKGLVHIKKKDAADRLILIETKTSDHELVSRDKSYYDLRGNRIKHLSTVVYPSAAPKEVQMSWDYDSMNRVTSWIQAEGSPDQKSSFYQYNKWGALEKEVRPDQSFICYNYDDLGYLKSLSSSDKTISYELTHNKLGQLVSATDTLTQKSLTRSYDANGRLIEETLPSGICFFHAYDELGNRDFFTANKSLDLFSVKYGYDALHLKKVTRQDGRQQDLYTHEYTKYDASGSLLAQTSPGQYEETTFSYDLLGRKTNISTSAFKHSITEYDALGRVKESNLQHDISNSKSNFSYDNLGQLTKEEGVNFQEYSYDSQHNRLRVGEQQFAYNELNQQQSPTFIYDELGNLIQNGSTRYLYDALNRLIEVITPDRCFEFSYDYLHRRTTKKAFEKDNDSWQELYAHHYLYDGQNEIGAIDSEENLLELRVLGNTSHAEIGSSISIELNGQLYIPTHDLHGNVVRLTDTQGTHYHYDYNAFGEEQLCELSANPWRYKSKRLDETGLVYFGRRYYDPTHGRWITQDPKGYADSWNLYAYVLNDPLAKMDLYGLEYEGSMPLSFPDALWSFEDKDCSLLFPDMNTPVTLRNGAIQGAARAYDWLVGGICMEGLIAADCHPYIPQTREVFEARSFINLAEKHFPADKSRYSYIGADFVGTFIAYGAPGWIYRGSQFALQEGLSSIQAANRLALSGRGAFSGVPLTSSVAKSTPSATIKELNRFHQAASQLSETGKNNIRILRGWAKSKGWIQKPNPHGGPEVWGHSNTNGKFQWNLKIKPECSSRTGLDAASNIPRCTARLKDGLYINPFTCEVGGTSIGGHIPLH